jgi:hypothetical protein
MLGSAVRKLKNKILDALSAKDVVYNKYDDYYYTRIKGESSVDLVHRSEVPEEELTGDHRYMGTGELEERPEVEPGDSLDEDDLEDDVLDNPRQTEHLDLGKQLKIEARQYSYSQELASQTARKAGSNRHIYSDVMNDPSIIDADSRVEAEAMIEAAQPSSNSSYSEVAAEAEADSGEADSGEADSDTGDSNVSVASDPGPSTDVDAYAEAAGTSSGDSGDSGGDSGFGSAGDSGSGDGGAGDSGIGGDGL